MKIAIHHREGSFSGQWINYCEQKQIPYKIVDALSNDIVKQLSDCDGFMWHWDQDDFAAFLFARQLTYSLEMVGKKVFPDSKTCWHYNDKIGQKYLWEASGAAHVPTYIFWDRNTALSWCDQTIFPKVFKLSAGAGSMNVSLVHTRAEARRLIKRAFGRGFPIVDRISLFKDRIWHLRRDRDFDAVIGIFKGIARLIVPTARERMHGREKGYVYFQDFIPDNKFDVRVIVTGDYAFGMRRGVRANDFRASGGGVNSFDAADIDISCVAEAFELSDKLKCQNMAYDFLFKDGKPVLTEASYAYCQIYRECKGYWDRSLQWHETKFMHEDLIIENFIASLS